MGATSGIGRELAQLYIAAGHKVGVTGRLTELVAQLGDLDLLIVSAGVGQLNPGLTWELEQQVIATNVLGFTQIVDFGFNYFKSRGSGHLAAITSIAAIRGDRGEPAYNASKAYQANYLEGIRKKAVKEKIKLTVTDLQPGFVDTAMAQGEGPVLGTVGQ